jgi:hypothetical protein
MDQKLSALTARGTPDRAVDQLYIINGNNEYRTTVNNMLGIASQPVGLSDSQTLTNKTLTAPTINSPVFGGTLSGTYTIGGTVTFPASVVTLTGTQTLINKTLTSPTINSPTITNASISADAITGFTTANNGTIYGLPVASGAVSGANLTPNTVPGSALTGTYRNSYQTDNNNAISNVNSTALKIQYGWGQMLGPGTSTMSELVTFPVAFTTILGISVSWIGFKSGGTVATDITQFGSAIGGGNLIQSQSPTVAGFTMSATSTGTFGAAYHGYSWLAWGL